MGRLARLVAIVVIAVASFGALAFAAEPQVVLPDQALESYQRTGPDDDPADHFMAYLESGSECQKTVVKNAVKTGYTGEYALHVKGHLAANIHSFGTYISLVHWPDTDLDLSKVDGIRFWIRVLSNSNILIRCSLYDNDGGALERWTTPDEQWKAAKIVQTKNDQWQEVVILLSKLKIPFWAPEPGNNSKLDRDQISRWELSFVSTTSAERSFEVELGSFAAYKDGGPQ